MRPLWGPIEGLIGGPIGSRIRLPRHPSCQTIDTSAFNRDMPEYPRKSNSHCPRSKDRTNFLYCGLPQPNADVSLLPAAQPSATAEPVAATVQASHPQAQAARARAFAAAQPLERGPRKRNHLNLNLPRSHRHPFRRLWACIFRRPIGLLELRRAEIAQRRADPGPVVDDLDVPERVQSRLLEGALEEARQAFDPLQPSCRNGNRLANGSGGGRFSLSSG